MLIMTRVCWAMQAYKQLPEKLSSELSKCQLYQCHVYLEAAMPPGKAPRMPHRLLEDCQKVTMRASLQSTCKCNHGFHFATSAPSCPWLELLCCICAWAISDVLHVPAMHAASPVPGSALIWESRLLMWKI